MCLKFAIVLSVVACARTASIGLVEQNSAAVDVVAVAPEADQSVETVREKREPKILSHLISSLFSGDRYGGGGGGYDGSSSSFASASSANQGGGYGGHGGGSGGGSFAAASAGSSSNGGGYGGHGGGSSANSQSASYSFGPFSASFSSSNANSNSNSGGGGGFFDYYDK